MKALQFRMSVPRIALTRAAGYLSSGAYTSDLAPVSLQEIPDAQIRGDRWVVVRPALTGICGSDQKQVLLKGHFDNPIASIISFPHVLGHESTGVVGEVGPGVTRVRPGDRVVINPWLSCEPRGISPICPACVAGNLSLCENFDKGDLSPGLHLGNCKDAPGAYATKVAVHQSQVFPLPANVSYEQAVLADPFCVSFHAVLKDPPDGDEPTVLVYGAGTIGLAAIAAVKVVKPKARVIVIARYPQQVDAARRLGAAEVITSSSGREIIDTVAALTDARLWRPRWHGLPMLSGGVDAVYDSICAPNTLEISVRITRPRGTVSIIGVEAPRRFEWTPIYFKELRVVGSNAFGIEEFGGVRKHAMEHYVDLCASGAVDLGFLVTHRYPLDEWKAAFDTAIKKTTGCVKVAFTFADARA
ncbi:MAG TPA: zinc-binding dehydrogenase [Myxococcota bacterium]|nr:zinc-binding dehydrogenase [Myxococcota bacterium]